MKRKGITISQEGLLRRLLGTRTEVDVALLDELQDELLKHIEGTHDPDEADQQMLESLTSLTLAVKYQPGGATKNARNLRARLRGIYDYLPDYHGTLRRHVYFFTKEALLEEIIEDWGDDVNPDGMVAIHFFERQLSRVDQRATDPPEHWNGHTRRMLHRTIVEHLKHMMPAYKLGQWVKHCSNDELIQRIGLARVFNGGTHAVQDDAYRQEQMRTAAYMRFCPAIERVFGDQCDEYTRVQRGINNLNRGFEKVGLDAPEVVNIDLTARSLSLSVRLRVSEEPLQLARLPQLVHDQVVMEFQDFEGWTAHVTYVGDVDEHAPAPQEITLGLPPF